MRQTNDERGIVCLPQMFKLRLKRNRNSVAENLTAAAAATARLCAGVDIGPVVARIRATSGRRTNGVGKTIEQFNAHKIGIGLRPPTTYQMESTRSQMSHWFVAEFLFSIKLQSKVPEKCRWTCNPIAPSPFEAALKLCVRSAKQNVSNFQIVLHCVRSECA